MKIMKRCSVFNEEIKKFLHQVDDGKFRYDPDYASIPCNETSDAVKLCQEPLVSVLMAAYNHEEFIRQAIDGVMMQQTDFAFELIIGEDCSSDKTREICFEYQRRYPEKIRVLWSETNQYDDGKSFGRMWHNIRGKYIAFCEGDDFWTDPLKLQKQIDVMRRNPTVGVCLALTDVLKADSGRIEKAKPERFPSGVVKSPKAVKYVLWGKRFRFRRLKRSHMQTSGFLFDRSVLERNRPLYDEIFNLHLSFDDTSELTFMVFYSDLYILHDSCSVYRRWSNGFSVKNSKLLNRDKERFCAFWRRRVDGWSVFRIILSRGLGGIYAKV